MADGKNSITFSYRDEKFSPKAVIHAFRYLSALTGIRFEPVERSPDVVFGSEGTSDSGQITADGDPVGRIIEAISFYANKARSDEGMKLSKAVLAVVKSLKASKLISSDRRAITIWPEGKKFGAVATHDIDIARRSVAGSLRLLFKSEPKGGFRGLVDSLNSYLGGRPNPYDRMPQWIELEEKLGISGSTYFVFVGDRYHPDDPKYKLNDIADSLASLAERGYEIALHSGIGYQDGVGLNDCRLSLERFTKRSISGVRPHFLKANPPRYWRKAEESGFSYSSCLGFDNRAGYYNGIDLPFVPFDTEKDESLHIVEIPVTIMDCGIIGIGDAASDKTARAGMDIIDDAADSGGLVVFDWHQRTLYNHDYPGWGTLFGRLIEHSFAKSAFFGRMSDIASLLKSRMSSLP
jgi:hypothetical protein